VVNDFPNLVIEEQCGSGEIKRLFAEPACAAWAFDGGPRQSAHRAKRGFQGFQFRPARRTRRSPTAFENLGAAKDT